MATISQELIAALDDLIQVGAQASASLREAVERLAGPRTWERNSIDVAMGTLGSVKTAVRTEATMPSLITSARDAVVKLQDVAQRMNETDLAGTLKMKVEAFSAQMKASGLGTPWLTILGIGAGAIAAWYLWKEYSKKKQVASFEYPEPEVDDIRPRLRGMGKALGSFAKYGKLGANSSSCRPLGRGKRLGRMGAADKYEFEPETRLEGFRGKRRRSVK